jgi:hypothetical protein
MNWLVRVANGVMLEVMALPKFWNLVISIVGGWLCVDLEEMDLRVAVGGMVEVVEVVPALDLLISVKLGHHTSMCLFPWVRF